MARPMGRAFEFMALTTLLAQAAACGGIVAGDSTRTGTAGNPAAAAGNPANAGGDGLAATGGATGQEQSGTGGSAVEPPLGGECAAYAGEEVDARNCKRDKDCVACEYHVPGDCTMTCCTDTVPMNLKACGRREEAWQCYCRSWSTCADDCSYRPPKARCINGLCAKVE